jgi:hypothetical protein
MQRFALLLLFAASAFAQEIAVSDPTFEEQAVESASIAPSGDRFITAWGRGNNAGVFFTITDLSGTLVRGPLTISLTGGHPVIASGSNGSLVAWLDGNSVYTANIDPDGEVGARTLLTSSRLLVGPSSVVWNGSQFLVLIRTAPAGVIGFVVAPSGETVAGPLSVSDWTAVGSANDSGFVVFATVPVDSSHPEKGFTIQARRIESNGAISEFTPTTTEIVTGALPEVAAVGHLLYWHFGTALHRVVTDSRGAPLSDSVIYDPYQLVKAVDTPSGTLLLSFETAPRSWLALIGPDGSFVTRKEALFSSDIAAIGTRAFLATPSPLRGYFADVTSTIQISGPINIGRMAVNQTFPQVASNGALLLAVWIEPSTSQLFAARIADGKHLDGRGIPIDSQVYLGQAPTVAALGNGFVVAYLEVSSGVAHLKIRRVFADGSLDAAPALVSPTAQPWAPRLASDGNQALLVWTENTYKVRGTRITRDGAVMDPAFLRISDGDNFRLQFAPDVGIDGDNYLVAWQSQSSQIRTAAVQVTKSGVVLDPPTVLPSNYSARVAGHFVAGSTGSNVLLTPLGGTPIDLGTRGFGDIEQFDAGILFVAPDPQGLWAAVVANDTIENRFTIVLPAAASQPSLTRTATGVEAAYLRGTGDEGYGGSLRAYVLSISQQRRRSALQAR